MNKEISLKIKEDKIIQQLLPFLKNTEAYLVGGYVRDLLLNKTSFDRDIVLVGENIELLVKQIAKSLSATFIVLDKEWEIFRIVFEDKKNYVDFARALNDDIKKDLYRRDITLNSIAYDLNKNELLDVNNGIQDIKNHIIKGISEENFIDDPLRILRVFRFQSALGFEIEAETKNIVKKYAKLLEKPAKERVNAELVKLFEGENTFKTLKNMDALGILELIFPFVSELKKIPPNSHHHLDLFNHSLEAVRQVEEKIGTLSENAQDVLNQIPYGTVKKYAFLKIATFMHDIGKPQTWTIDEATGRHRFIKHDTLGADLAPKYLKELKFSKKQIAYIQKLIKNHIYPSNVNGENEKSITKFIRKMGSDTVDVILLAMADRLSARGEDITEQMVKENIQHLQHLLVCYFEQLESIKPLPKLLSGNEIMEILSISPSPKLGEIINSLKTAQEDGEVVSKEEAVEFVKNFK